MPVRVRALRLGVAERALLPPPARRWGRFGRSYVVPPFRAERPELVFLGDDVLVHEDVWISNVAAFPGVEPRVVIEDGVRIGRGCFLSVVGGLHVGRGAVIGDFVHLADTFHPYQATDRMAALTPPRPVRIGAGAVVSGHAVVLPGVTVGAGAVVEHHAVVTANVAPGTRVAGNPARCPWT